MGPFWLKLGCPYSQNWFQYVRWDAPRVDPTTIQTVSKPYPNHIRPSYQQSLGGSFVAKISPFWASSDHKWGCPISNLSKDHWYPMLYQDLQKISNVWQFFLSFLGPPGDLKASALTSCKLLCTVPVKLGVIFRPITHQIGPYDLTWTSCNPFHPRYGVLQKCHLKLCLPSQGKINMFCDCDFHQLLQINDTLLCQKCLFFVWHWLR